MGLFPIVSAPFISQVGDVVRISAVKTFKNGDTGTIHTVNIKPDTAEAAVDVHSADQADWVLDWVYDTAGSKTLELEVTAGAGMSEVTETRTVTLTVKTKADDALFSSDDDLSVIEPDILKWIPEGFSNWNHVHRLSQKNILEWLDEIRLFKADGSAWEAADLVNRSQVRKLSLYMTLEIIFKSLSNQTDDIYSSKAAYYAEKKTRARDRNYLDLDVNGDGEISVDEKADLRTVTLVRR